MRLEAQKYMPFITIVEKSDGGPTVRNQLLSLVNEIKGKSLLKSD